VPNAQVCVSFCHIDTIGKGKFKDDKKMHDKTFLRAEVRNKETKSQNPKIRS
jgi:hypothetical protein